MYDVKKMLSGMDEQIKSIALMSPRLAWMLTRGVTLDPRAYCVRATWDTTAIDRPILTNQFDESIYNPFWLWDITYAIRRPNANSGVFGKLEEDHYAQLMPYIDIDITVRGKNMGQEVTNGWVPLESFATPTPTNAFAQMGFVFTRDGRVVVDAINKRAFTSDEMPYELVLTFSGLELGSSDCPACDIDDMICDLRSAGLYPPKPVK